MSDIQIPSCIDCNASGCAKATKEYPAFCKTPDYSEFDRQTLIAAYHNGDTERIMKNAAASSAFATKYKLCRVEETMEFARRMGYRKIGIAVCAGLIEEGRTLAAILRANGFEVCGIVCKIGTVTKAELGLSEEECGTGVSCNPLLQAAELNKEHTDLNIVVGLCVGHDALFLKNSESPCTVMVVKDRALKHNPAAALHDAAAEGEYARLLSDRK